MARTTRVATPCIPQINPDPRFSYGTVDYDSESRRGDHSECDSICRCEVISSVRINSISVDGFIKNLIKHSEKLDEVTKYCIDRVCRAHKVYDTNKWSPNIGGGYYGQEIDGFDFNNIDAVVSDVHKLLSMSSQDDVIRFSLTREYGYLLEGLDKATFKVAETFIDSITFGQREYTKRLGSQEYDFASDIIGLVRMTGSKFSVVDGYHRILSVKQATDRHDKKLVKVLYYEEA